MFFLFTGGWQATSPGPCDPSSGPFLERIVRRRTASAGCRPFFIISDPNPNSPLFTMRVGKRTTMPVGSRTGHRQNEPVRTRCDIPSSPYNTIATQQRTNETIVRAAQIYFIKIYSSIFIKNIINYQTFNLFTSRSPRTRRNPGVFSSPCRATEHTIDKAFAPDTRNASGSARPGGFCVEPATGIPLIPCPSRPSPGRIKIPTGQDGYR